MKKNFDQNFRFFKVKLNWNQQQLLTKKQNNIIDCVVRDTTGIILANVSILPQPNQRHNTKQNNLVGVVLLSVK